MAATNEHEGSNMVSGFVNRLPFSVKASVAELIATAIFVYIGTGTPSSVLSLGDAIHDDVR